MTKQESVIKFQAQIGGIRTMVDGGVNITLGLGKKEIKALGKLLEISQQEGIILECAIVPIKYSPVQETKNKNEPRRKQRYPYRTK